MQNIINCLDNERVGLIGLQEAQHFFPKGWHVFLDDIWHLADLIGNVRVTRIGIDKGLLRVTVETPGDIEASLFKRVTQSVARESSLKCMECGKRGFRRKIEQGWPSLCGVHYVEYVNFLDQNKE